MKNEKIFVSKQTVNLIFIFYFFGLIILLYFRPQDQNYGTINLIPFETILSGHVDYLIAVYNLGANIGLFLPFGLYYRYVIKNPMINHLILITIGSISIKLKGYNLLLKEAV